MPPQLPLVPRTCESCPSSKYSRKDERCHDNTVPRVVEHPTVRSSLDYIYAGRPIGEGREANEKPNDNREQSERATGLLCAY